MLGTSFILLLQLHSQIAGLEHGGLLMIEQDSQLEICDVIWKHCGSKNQVTYNGSAFFQ